RLSAQTEENEVVPRQDRVHDLGHHGVLVADDAGEQGTMIAQPRQQVLTHLVLHRPQRAIRSAKWRPLQCTESFGILRHRVTVSSVRNLHLYKIVIENRAMTHIRLSL